MLRVLPEMMRLGSHRSVYDLVSRYIRDERLRQAFTFEPLLVGGNPFRTTSIYLLIHWLERKWGVHFAMGGTTAIVHGWCGCWGDRRRRALNTPVAEIEVRGGRGRRRTGVGRAHPGGRRGEQRGPVVGLRRMIDARHRRGTPTARRAQAAVDEPLRRLLRSAGSTRSWRTTRSCSGRATAGCSTTSSGGKVLADDFSLYLHAPTRTDPSLAPPGTRRSTCSRRCRTTAAASTGAGGEPVLRADPNRARAAAAPGLGASPVEPFFLTPDDFEHTLRSEDGAAFGPEPILTQSAYFRYHNRSDDVGGLYFVGAGTHPGGGVPGVLCSAKVLERVVPAAGRRRLRWPAGAGRRAMSYLAVPPRLHPAAAPAARVAAAARGAGATRARPSLAAIAAIASSTPRRGTTTSSGAACGGTARTG
jgi:phytoene desaturase